MVRPTRKKQIPNLQEAIKEGGLETHRRVWGLGPVTAGDLRADLKSPRPLSITTSPIAMHW